MSQPLLHHRIIGQGPLLVLFHPVGLDGSFWGDLPQRLLDRYRVVAVDLRGHGQSSPAPRPGTMAASVEDVAELIRHLTKAHPDAGAQAIILGLSFGGMIAQNLALQHPELVRALVICGCGPQIPAAFREAIIQRGKDAEAGGMASVVPQTLERWFTPSFMASPVVEAVRQRLLSDDPSHFASAWEAISGHDALARLPQVMVPALVIGGSVDLATPVEAIRTMAKAFAKGQQVILEGAPHMMQLENGEAFFKAVRHFLDGLEH
jgi:3-oxoadipate enol-lactonase